MSRRLPLLLLATLLPGLVLAQGRVPGADWRGSSRLGQLGEDIMVLYRVVPLRLTDEQLEAALEAYREDAAAGGEAASAEKQLAAMRERLIGGTPLVATDLATLRELWRSAARSGRGRERGAEAAPTALSPLAAKLWGLLDQTQRAALLGDVRQAAANNQRFDRAAATRALETIGRLRQLDEPTWRASCDRLADCLCAASGAPGSPARDNSRRMFLDFLARLRKMPAADFSGRQTELSAELCALMPPGSSLTAAMAEFEPRLIQTAMEASLLHPRAPALLAEIRAARTTQTPAQ